MNEKEIILSSSSMADLTVKLFGYANSVAKEKTIKILEKNGFGLDVFNGKNKTTIIYVMSLLSQVVDIFYFESTRVIISPKYVLG
jgi:hypothetical protein